MLLFLVSCLSEQMLTNKIIEERIIYDTAYVEVIIEVETEVEIEIEVPVSYPLWSQTYLQPSLGNGVDILWVVDPSGSMIGNWPQVVLGVEQMMLALPINVNWRLEIIPTDQIYARSLNSFPILPGDSLQVAQDHLTYNVNGYSEKGMDAVKTYIQYNSDAHNWMRPEVALLIVFVSDENDSSGQGVSTFTTWLGNLRSEVFVTSVTNVSQATSLCPTEFSISDIGYKYMSIASQFGGITIDICDPDWSAGVAQAAHQVSLIEEVQLDYLPVDIDHIEVLVDNLLWNDWTWDIPNNKILFTVLPPEGSIITVSYNYL